MENLNYPVTIAKKLTEDFIFEKKLPILTITENYDEKVIYEELSSRLLKLEKTLMINYKELNSIQESSKNFNVEINFKKNIIKRINWINHLYKVWEHIPHIKTDQQAKETIKTLSVIQTSPLKNEVKKELETLVNSYQTTETSQINQFMDLAIDQAGDEFINLNSAGREHIINELVKEYKNKATLQQVKEYTNILNKQSNELKEIQNEEQFEEELAKLPLNFFHTNSTECKKYIITKLVMKKNWNGLAELDASITKYNNEFIKQEHDIKKDKINKAINRGKLSTLDFDIAKNQSIISIK